MERKSGFWRDGCYIWECQYILIERDNDGPDCWYKVPFSEKMLKRYESEYEAERNLKEMVSLKVI